MKNIENLINLPAWTKFEIYYPQIIKCLIGLNLKILHKLLTANCGIQAVTAGPHNQLPSETRQFEYDWVDPVVKCV